MAKKKKVKKSKLTQQQLDQRQAAKLVDQELAPTVAEINRQKAEAAADAVKRQAFTTGLSTTVAGMAGAYAPAVQQTYQQVGENQSNFAKGFSDAFKSEQNKAAAQINTTLQQSGAPAGQMAAGDTGAADALYGIGGYEPASTFNREGAGWTAAAARLPTTVGLAGQQQLAAAQTQDRKSMDDILAQLTQVKLKRPGLINDVLGQIQTNRSKAQQQAWENTLAAQAFGLKASTANATLKLNTYKAQTDAAYKAGLLALKKQGINISLAKLKQDAKNGGMTTSQWFDLQQTSGKLASEAYSTAPKRERQPNGTYKTVNTKQRKTYQEALAEQQNNGVPQQMAVATLNRVYKAGAKKGGRPYYATDLKRLTLASLKILARKVYAVVYNTTLNTNPMSRKELTAIILKDQPMNYG
jgi:hypothetical protein